LALFGKTEVEPVYRRSTSSFSAACEAPVDSVGLIAVDESPAYQISSFSVSCKVMPCYKVRLIKFFRTTLRPYRSESELNQRFPRERHDLAYTQVDAILP